MEPKTFSIVTTAAIVFMLAAAVLNIINVVIAGLYPGNIVLLVVAMIPVASRLYAKKSIGKSPDFLKSYFTTFTIINLLSILIVAWMTFVILVDRVFSKVL